MICPVESYVAVLARAMVAEPCATLFQILGSTGYSALEARRSGGNRAMDTSTMFPAAQLAYGRECTLKNSPAMQRKHLSCGAVCTQEQSGASAGSDPIRTNVIDFLTGWLLAVMFGKPCSSPFPKPHYAALAPRHFCFGDFNRVPDLSGVKARLSCSRQC